LHRAVELGVNFFDTADVYGDGRSERLVAELRRAHPHIRIATKAGRRLSPHVAAGYTRENLTAFVERSLTNLAIDVIDLLQLHCPPTDVYYMPEVFNVLDDLVAAGKLRHYGVSVERVEEGLKAIEFPGVQSVQIIFNAFRQRPAERFLGEAARRGVGVIARVPLASGLLSGKVRTDTTFAPDDHRQFNRHGEAFDRGETFSGVDLAAGVRAVDELRSLCAPSESLAQLALCWILSFPEVTCTIPGAKRREQVQENTAASGRGALDPERMAAIRAVYDRHVRPLVHDRW
jgi:aryl-alcohol dehydrogenase-like predicted oxidoreductase